MYIRDKAFYFNRAKMCRFTDKTHEAVANASLIPLTPVKFNFLHWYDCRQWRIQDFPEGTLISCLRDLLFWSFFPGNCIIKFKQIGPREERATYPHLLRSATVYEWFWRREICSL